MAVEERKGLGISWGRPCSITALILGIFYLLVSLAYSLTTRLYLKAYYSSAHVSGLGVVVALFVISHHSCRIRQSLGCCLRLFAIVQTVLNLLFLLCNLAMAAGYIIISVISIHMNFDYIVGAIFACINVLWLLYLNVTSCAATRGDRYMGYEVDVQFVWHSDSLGGIANDMELFGYPAYGDVGTGKTDKGSMGTNTSLMTKSSDKQPKSKCCKCNACCRRIWNVIFGFFYFVVQLLLIVIFALSACHPVFIAADTFQYRDSTDLYTVSVEGHRPLALFLKCRGKGNDTIVLENGLGSSAYINWNFIPRFLEDKYVVCVTDRRGYGWSETYEYDNISLLRDDERQQWSLTNSRFFVELVKAAKIKTPFYYAGHSYGGHHLVQVAIHNPELVKGLIFLDSAYFSPISEFQKYLEVINNFKALGLIYILTETRWFDFGKAFEDSLEFDAMPTDIQKQTLSSVRTGYYFASYNRENKGLNGDDDFAYQGIARALTGQQITAPAYVIDAGNSNPGWFPKEHFTQYSQNNHYSYVPGASHGLLVASNKYGNITSGIMDAYIQYDLDKIGEIELRNRIQTFTCTQPKTTFDSNCPGVIGRR